MPQGGVVLVQLFITVGTNLSKGPTLSMLETEAAEVETQQLLEQLEQTARFPRHQTFS